jgi:hypothetical protein
MKNDSVRISPISSSPAATIQITQADMQMILSRD